jgi:hypothetical protein
MTKPQRDLLTILARCPPGKGELVNKRALKVARQLARKGWVEIWGAGILNCACITDTGRDALNIHNREVGS